jgi:hypothetical protein
MVLFGHLLLCIEAILKKEKWLEVEDGCPAESGFQAERQFQPNSRTHRDRAI